MIHNLSSTQKFTSLEELRIFHNQRFIRLAYRSILGREPDSKVLQNYCISVKPEIVLEHLKNSDEAKVHYSNSRVLTQKYTESEVTLKNLSETSSRIDIEFIMDKVRLEVQKYRDFTIDSTSNRRK